MLVPGDVLIPERKCHEDVLPASGKTGDISQLATMISESSNLHNTFVTFVTNNDLG